MVKWHDMITGFVKPAEVSEVRIVIIHHTEGRNGIIVFGDILTSVAHIMNLIMMGDSRIVAGTVDANKKYKTKNCRE